MNDGIKVEDEDATPVGPAVQPELDPLDWFTQAAVDAGMIRSGEKLDSNMAELCLSVVSITASTDDRYGIPEVPEENVGDDIPKSGFLLDKYTARSKSHLVGICNSAGGCAAQPPLNFGGGTP